MGVCFIYFVRLLDWFDSIAAHFFWRIVVNKVETIAIHSRKRIPSIYLKRVLASIWIINDRWWFHHLTDWIRINVGRIFVWNINSISKWTINYRQFIRLLLFNTEFNLNQCQSFLFCLWNMGCVGVHCRNVSAATRLVASGIFVERFTLFKFNTNGISLL